MKTNNRQAALSRQPQSHYRRLGFLLLSALVGAWGAVRWTTQAANPSSGTLSSANRIITYTAGPFLTSNPSATGTGAPTCTAQTCDDFALTVTVPVGATNSTVKVTTSWPDANEDYDLYVNNAAGQEVGSAATSALPETLTFTVPASGTYTVRNVPFLVTGGSISVRLEFTPGTAAPTPTPGVSPTPTPVPVVVPGAPRYANYQAPAALGNSAGEPTIGVSRNANGSTRATMYIAGLQTLRIKFDECSSPAKALWENVSAPQTSVNTLDPILFTDPVSNRTQVSQLAGKASLSAFTDNDGMTWQPSQGTGINSGVDHQTIGGGAFAPGIVGNTHPRAVYYCSQDIAVANCALSRDGGLTYGAAVPIWNLSQCRGLHGHVKVAPNDGTAYVPNGSCTGTAGVAVSTDNGTTWTVRKIPGLNVGDDPSVGIGAGGRVYVGHASGNGNGEEKALISYSNDRGATWSTPVDVGASLGIKSVTFPVVIAGDNDRAAFAFVGTTTGGDSEATGVFQGEWHLYVAHTYDGGLTWTTVDITPNDPVQRGSICEGGTTCGNDRNLLDFNGITVDGEGRVQIAYADGCISAACIGGGANDFTDKATIARLESGRRLYAINDITEPTVPKAPNVTANQSATNVMLSWAEPDNGGSRITSYNVYRKTGMGGTYALIGSTDRLSYQDFSITSGTQYFYQVKAVNAVGEGLNCLDVAPVVPIVPNLCAVPGQTVTTDATGDQVGDASLDIQSISVAEPFFGQPNDRVVFTMKIGIPASTAANPPGAWYVIWSRPTPDASFDRNYVVMKTTGTTTTFEYGQVTSSAVGTLPAPNAPTMRGTLGTGNTGSGTYNRATGVITFTVPKALVEIGGANSSINTIEGRSFVNPAAPVVTQAASQDNTGGGGSYTVQTNFPCRPQTPPVAALTATPISGNAPLDVMFSGAGSSDADNDAIQSYSIDFGDGMTLGGSSPSFTHRYTQAGTYRVTLRVTDARGAVSTNVAAATITVTDNVPQLARLDLGNTNSSTAQTLVGGCRPDRGRVEISRPAPAGGFPVTLGVTNLSGAASVPTTVTVPAGQTFVEFFTTTFQVSAAQTGTVTAVANGVNLAQALTVRPVKVRSMTLTQTTVTGAQTVTGTATLECPMVNPLNVALTSSVPSVATVGSTSLTFTAGQTSQTFSVMTQPQTNRPKATIINATAPGASTVGVKLTVNP